jgi:hypothetical protein
MNNDIAIQRSILDILSAVRWQEQRDGSPCHITRDNALRVILGLLNRVSNRSAIAPIRAKLFAAMNEAKKNLPEM